MITYILITILVILIVYNLSKTKEGLQNNKTDSYSEDYKEMKQKLDHLKQGAQQNEKAIKEIVKKIKGKGNEAHKASKKVPKNVNWPSKDKHHHD
tara:strand:- start:814 stop:1098 length:285 start_codon:yes stop_codon:yes gene_type:complete